MISKRAKRGCLVAVLAGASVVGGLALYAFMIPAEAPLPRMYRTEALLAGLTRAVEMYHRRHGQYPPAGSDGLMWAEMLGLDESGYYPPGPPRDAWGRPFRYVPADSYDEASAAAIRSAEGYDAPVTYQLYSLGADGQAGGAEPDDITSWLPDQPWRGHYVQLHEDYVNEHRWGCEGNESAE